MTLQHQKKKKFGDQEVRAQKQDRERDSCSKAHNMNAK